jgi:hypothetical protein
MPDDLGQPPSLLGQLRPAETPAPHIWLARGVAHEGSNKAHQELCPPFKESDPLGTAVVATRWLETRPRAFRIAFEVRFLRPAW